MLLANRQPFKRSIPTCWPICSAPLVHPIVKQGYERTSEERGDSWSKLIPRTFIQRIKFRSPRGCRRLMSLSQSLVPHLAGKIGNGTGDTTSSKQMLPHLCVNNFPAVVSSNTPNQSPQSRDIDHKIWNKQVLLEGTFGYSNWHYYGG